MPYRGWKGQTFASTHGRLRVLPEQQSAGLRSLTASVYPRVGFDWCGGPRLTTTMAARSGQLARLPLRAAVLGPRYIESAWSAVLSP